MTEDLPPGPGIAVLVIPMPGGDRGMETPTDTVAAMIAWLSRHDGPRTGEVFRRLERDGWTLELPDPVAAIDEGVAAGGVMAGHKDGVGVTNDSEVRQRPDFARAGKREIPPEVIGRDRRAGVGRGA